MEGYCDEVVYHEIGVEQMQNKENKGKEENKELKSEQKWRYTLYTTIIFLIVANPLTYKLVNYLLGFLLKISDSSGCPTTVGFLVHAVVFTLLLRYLMELKI